MKITLVRHAEVEKAFIGKYNGHIDIGLSKNGYEQAKKLAYELQEEDFDAVYCSDLIRARETLDAFDLSVEVIYTEKLREKSWGIHEGKSFQEIEASGIKYKNFNQWINELDGENIQSYTNRLRDFFHNTLLRSSAKNILLVSHSGFIKTLLTEMEEKTLEESFAIQLPYASFIKKTLL